MTAIGLALGGGGARGLAHLHVLRAFDDLGVKPAQLSGTSIGAMVAAAYASGHSGQAIIDHVLEATKSRQNLITRGLGCRVGNLFSSGWQGMLLDGEKLMRTFMPPLKEQFSELHISLHISTTDYYGRSTHPISEGPVYSAVAASMALPTIIQPVKRDHKVLIDGGYFNNLPYDLLPNCTHTIAVDVTGGPKKLAPGEEPELPAYLDGVLNSLFLMVHAATEARLKTLKPDLLITPPIEAYQVLDFHKSAEILEATSGVYEETKAFLKNL